MPKHYRHKNNFKLNLNLPFLQTCVSISAVLKTEYLMNTIFRILNNQLELNDSLDSYDSWVYLKKEILEDEKGKYQIRKITYEHPCSCHPETCCHFDGKTIREREEKVYLKP